MVTCNFSKARYLTLANDKCLKYIMPSSEKWRHWNRTKRASSSLCQAKFPVNVEGWENPDYHFAARISALLPPKKRAHTINVPTSPGPTITVLAVILEHGVIQVNASHPSLMMCESNFVASNMDCPCKDTKVFHIMRHHYNSADKTFIQPTMAPKIVSFGLAWMYLRTSNIVSAQ